jgi:hypothetical protein
MTIRSHFQHRVVCAFAAAMSVIVAPFAEAETIPFANSDPFSDPCNITLQPSDLTGDAGLDDLVDDGTPGNAHYPLLSDRRPPVFSSTGV